MLGWFKAAPKSSKDESSIKDAMSARSAFFTRAMEARRVEAERQSQLELAYEPSGDIRGSTVRLVGHSVKLEHIVRIVALREIKCWQIDVFGSLWCWPSSLENEPPSISATGEVQFHLVNGEVVSLPCEYFQAEKLRGWYEAAWLGGDNLRTLESEGQKWDEEARARKAGAARYGLPPGAVLLGSTEERHGFVPLNPCAKSTTEERLRELVDIARRSHPIGDDPVERIRELRD